MDALWTYIAEFKNRRTKILNPLFKPGTKTNGINRPFSTGSNASKTPICDLHNPRKTRCSKLSRLYERVKDIVFRSVNHDPFESAHTVISDTIEATSTTFLRRCNTALVAIATQASIWVWTFWRACATTCTTGTWRVCPSRRPLLVRVSSQNR